MENVQVFPHCSVGRHETLLKDLEREGVRLGSPPEDLVEDSLRIPNVYKDAGRDVEGKSEILSPEQGIDHDFPGGEEVGECRFVDHGEGARPDQGVHEFFSRQNGAILLAKSQQAFRSLDPAVLEINDRLEEEEEVVACQRFTNFAVEQASALEFSAHFIIYHQDLTLLALPHGFFALGEDI